jgi:hypothetical protein
MATGGPAAGPAILRCYIIPDLREVLPCQEDAAFLARLDRAVKHRLGPEAAAVLDYSRVDQPGPAWPHRLETGGRPWDGPEAADLAQELVIQAFNGLFC